MQPVILRWCQCVLGGEHNLFYGLRSMVWLSPRTEALWRWRLFSFGWNHWTANSQHVHWFIITHPCDILITPHCSQFLLVIPWSMTLPIRVDIASGQQLSVGTTNNKGIDGIAGLAYGVGGWGSHYLIWGLKWSGNFFTDFHWSCPVCGLFYISAGRQLAASEDRNSPIHAADWVNCLINMRLRIQTCS